MRRFITGCAVVAIACLLANFAGAADEPWVTFEGKQGPGKGKQIVFVTGDEEYRSEESMPQLAKILAERHGFTCTVLFAIDKKTGEINTTLVDNIPGLEKLKDADLMILFTRFRELPDEQMTHFMDYTNSGKPIIALRTATHPFAYKKNLASPYAKWSYNSKDPKGGYGREVLGETWVNHWGAHQKESTRGVPAPGMEHHPLLRGVTDIWGPSDVYEITTLAGDAKPVVMGQVLKGMNPTDEVNTAKKVMPVAWIKTYKGEGGKASRIFTTTMGHAGDLKNEGFRRLMVNAVYWLLDMEVPLKANVDLVGAYDPLPIGFGKHRPGVKPADFKK
jgi:type 1 glutamine amidotransferase